MTERQRMVSARGGVSLPALGLGTWKMGEKRGQRKAEVAALQYGLDLGLGLVDTAEMYASGGAEQVVSEAIRGRRDEVYLVSKVLPSNASRKGTIKAAERSLKHLNCDHIDLYLLHWPSPYPLEETIEAFERLTDDGKIGRYGVSNFDAGELEDAMAASGGDAICVNQILYNPAQRAIEAELLPWCTARDIALMAYSPLDQGSILQDAILEQIADGHGVTTATVAVAWTLRFPNMVSIPKATAAAHVDAVAAARDMQLTDEDLAAIDRAFPPPEPGARLAIY
ncbi:MAG: aldo/keto reductase [Proteobacteria bacterium]|nr:aldo/keto reductase [Pseudomonadota bacterium]MDA1356438.1 aldo/keto reductase [Pseudomonadota bacterium]